MVNHQPSKTPAFTYLSGRLSLTKSRPLNQSTGPVVIKTAPKLRLENERTVLSHLRNQPYIRQLVDEIPESESNPPGLVLKRLDDNLLEAADVKRLKRGEVRLIARDILKGLKVLHEAGWVHTGTLFISHME